jgi:hypothetical protein
MGSGKRAVTATSVSLAFDLNGVSEPELFNLLLQVSMENATQAVVFSFELDGRLLVLWVHCNPAIAEAVRVKLFEGGLSSLGL